MREPVSGHEVVKKKRDCNNLEKETASFRKGKSNRKNSHRFSN